MAIVCSCEGISYGQYCDAVRKLSTQIEIAGSFKKAVGIVFRDQHPKVQTEPADILGTKRNCQSCTPYIAEAIHKEGLRTETEYKQWLDNFNDRMNKCGDNPNAAIFANNFNMPS